MERGERAVPSAFVWRPPLDNLLLVGEKGPEVQNLANSSDLI